MNSEIENIDASNISEVLLVGGTHGNELTGINLLRHWRKTKKENNYLDFNLQYLIANPAALEVNKRYIDHDLNRCFKNIDLKNESLTSREQLRAKEINQLIGPKGDSKTDFIIDLHTSTANMQTNIVLTRIDTFHLQLALYLKKELPDVVITSVSDIMSDQPFLESVAPRGIVIEVGPIPQGSIEYNCFKITQKAVEKTLAFVESYNKLSADDLEQLKQSDEQLEIMSYHGKINFPLDDQGNIVASVHPNLIGIAYPEVRKGDAIFKGFDGIELLYQGEPTSLAFVNEAAYYDQRIALCLCRPVIFSLGSCKPT